MKRCIVMLLFLMTTSCFAEPAILWKKKGGIDYRIQGEYTGKLADGKPWAAQVIATGKGTFKAIGFEGGLPGAGWSGTKTDYATGKLEDKKVKMDASEFSLVIDGQSIDVVGTDGSSYGSLKKVERKSKTLGMEPPKDAMVLFANGKGVKKWHKGKLAQKKLLAATDCSTKEKFGDHKLHIEFKTPFMPQATGQHRGNSGVYVQSRYEVQVLDSFGLEGKDNECGGIYQVSKPKVNMCFPPLNWQTYDIDFTAAKWEGEKKVAPARITVVHNGVVIHKDLELPKHTPGRHKEGPEPDALFLQDHSNPVVFRNVWIVKK